MRTGSVGGKICFAESYWYQENEGGKKLIKRQTQSLKSVLLFLAVSCNGKIQVPSNFFNFHSTFPQRLFSNKIREKGLKSYNPKIRELFNVIFNPLDEILRLRLEISLQCCMKALFPPFKIRLNIFLEWNFHRMVFYVGCFARCGLKINTLVLEGIVPASQWKDLTLMLFLGLTMKNGREKFSQWTLL